MQNEQELSQKNKRQKKFEKIFSCDSEILIDGTLFKNL